MFIRKSSLVLLCAFELMGAASAFGHGAEELADKPTVASKVVRDNVKSKLTVDLIPVDELPVTKPAPGAACMASIEDAVKEAVGLAMELDPLVEWGGVILERPDGCLLYTQAVTNNHTEALRYRIARPKGSKVVALYHTHPSGQHSHKFSFPDMETVREMKVPSFIGVRETMELRKLAPGFRDDADVRMTIATGMHPGHEGTKAGIL